MNKVYYSSLCKLLFVFAVLLGLGANAQVTTEISPQGVYVGDRTSTTSLSNPFSSYNRYAYGQMLFTSNELTSMTITGITLYMSSENTTTHPYNLTLYLGEVSRSSFNGMPDDYVPLSSMTQVFSGSGTYPESDSLTLVFNTSFQYSGQGNLVLAVDLNQSANNLVHRFKGYNTTKWMPYWRQNADIDPASPPSSAFYGGTTYFNLRFVGNTGSCPAPSGFGSEQSDLSSLRVFWQGDTTSLGYEVEYGPQNFDPGQGTMLTTTDTSLLLTSVQPGATYKVYVRSICGQGDTSQWSEPYLVSALRALPVTNYPYSCDFNSDSLINTWQRVHEASGSYCNRWAFTSAPHHTDSPADSTNICAHISYDGTSYAYSDQYPDRCTLGRDFVLEPGVYRIDFDWKCEGNDAEFFRVAMDDVENEPTVVGWTYNSLPSGAIALDGGVALRGSTTWQHHQQTFTVTHPMTRRLFLYWISTSYYSEAGDHLPAAIDNLSLQMLRVDSMPRVIVEATRQYGDALHHGSVEARYIRNSHCAGGYYAWVAPASEVVNANNIMQLGAYLTSDTTYIWHELSAGTYVLYTLPVGAGASVTTDTVQVPVYNEYGLIVGDTNSNTVSFHFPYENFYKYSWVQMIYPADSLHGECEITQIAFKVSDDYASSFPTRDINIYMGHTLMTGHSTNSSWVPNSELTWVYYGTNDTIGSQSGWETVVLDDPFVYDGTSNLVIVVGKYAESYTNALRYSTFTPVGGESDLPTLVRASDSDGSYAYYPWGSGTNGMRCSSLPILKITTAEGLSCPPVEHGSMALTTSGDSLLLSWGSAGGNAHDYDVEYGPSGYFDPVTAANVTLITYSYDTVLAIPEFDGGEQVDFCLRTVCQGASSRWTYFNNRCVPIYKLPFVEDFESQIAQGPNSNMLNDCWEGYSWGENGSYNQLSSNNTKQVMLGDHSVLSLPQMVEDFDIRRLELSFDVESPFQTLDLRVGVMDDYMDTSTLVTMASFSDALSTRCTVHFVGYHGEGRHIVFFVGDNYLYLDNIELILAPEYSIQVASNDSTLGGVTMVYQDEDDASVCQRGTFLSGSHLLLTASPAENAHFVAWNDGDTTNPRLVTLVADTTIMAFFEALDVNVELVEEGEVTLYPNPVDDWLTVVLPSCGSEVALFDLSGRELMVRSAAGNSLVVDVRGLPTGIYMLRAKGDWGVARKKIIVRH